MVKVKYYSVTGEFRVVKTVEYRSLQQALHEIENYVHINGFSKMREIEDVDVDFEILRVTATSPNGRAGRNVALVELGWD